MSRLPALILTWSFTHERTLDCMLSDDLATRSSMQRLFARNSPTQDCFRSDAHSRASLCRRRCRVSCLLATAVLRQAATLPATVYSRWSRESSRFCACAAAPTRRWRRPWGMRSTFYCRCCGGSWASTHRWTSFGEASFPRRVLQLGCRDGVPLRLTGLRPCSVSTEHAQLRGNQTAR